MNRTNIRDVQESKLSHVQRKQLELQLLRAFDDQVVEEQYMERKSSLLPKGLLNRNYTKKPYIKQDLIRKNFSTSSKKNISKQNKKSTSRKILLLKAIQQPQKLKYRYEDSFHFKQQPTNRSNGSKMSMLSAKSYHHNKRKRVMTEFYQQKETQKLVKRLLHVKPSQQVAKQAQLNSYKKHVMAKNIMMHRVTDQPIKKDITPLKNKQSKGSTIDLKQKDLRKFLKQERTKTRQQSLLQKKQNNKQSTSIIYKRRRFNTLQAEDKEKKQLYSKSNALISRQPSLKLPKVKIFNRVQSMPIERSFTFKDKYKTPLQSRNKNYF